MYTIVFSRSTACIICIVVSLLACLSAIEGADSWPHYGCNPAFTSFSSAEDQITPATINQIDRLWGIGCDDGYFSVYSRSPAIWNGRLYATGAGAPLRCYDAKTGELHWSYGGTQTGWTPQPTVTSDGIVLYLQGEMTNYNLKAINGMTGSLIWTSPLQFNLGYNNTTVVNVDESRNQVLLLEEPFAPDTGKLFALNLDSGEINWYMSKALDGFSFVGNYVVRSGTTIYAGIVEESWSRERVGVIDLVTRELDDVWQRPGETSSTYIASITLCDDALAVTFLNGNGEPGGDLVVYDTADGSVNWSYTVTSHITGDVAYNPELDRLYLPTNPKLYALSLDQTPGDIEPDWTHTGFDAIYSPTVAGGIVYFLADTNAYALDELDGTKIKNFPLGEQAYETTQVAVCDGAIYFSGNGGTCDLFAYGFPPPCDTLGVELWMPAKTYEWMDPCACSVTVCNPGDTQLNSVPLFVLLDVYGTYFFAPSFTNDPDFYTVNPPPGTSTVEVLPEFNWPPAVGSADGIIWYAAMTNAAMNELQGEMDTWEFGWQ